MKLHFRLILILSVIVMPSLLMAQQNSNVYIQSTSRSVPVGGNAAFLEFVREVIKPMYAEAVDSGHLQGWYMWQARYRSTDETYRYVFASTSPTLANLESSLPGGSAAAAQQVHGMSVQEFNNRVQQGSSTVVKSELWIQRPISVLEGGVPPRYAAVRFYRSHPGERQTIFRELNDFSTLWQQGRLDSGISAGWGFFSLGYPIDSADSYDSAEISYYDEFSQVLGAGIGQQIWNDVRPDNSEISEHQSALSTAREMVKSELWELVEYDIAD